MQRFFILFLLFLAGCSTEPAAPGRKVWGIDVSKHQRRIDWGSVMGNNAPDFVFLKATEGTLIVDPTYGHHCKQLDERGVLYGAYHFFGHRTPGKEQARNFIKTANLKRGNLVPVLDIEKHRFMTDPRKSAREARAFCREIRRYYGVNPIIYCSTKFYEDYLREDFPENKYVLWIADYRGDPDHIGWDFWQHTDSHKLTGVSGNVDRNLFNGDIKKLKKLTL